jgi:hypothetical protein
LDHAVTSSKLEGIEFALGVFSMTAKIRRKSSFVPRIVMRTAVVAVVPACAAAVACGGETGSGADAGSDHVVLGVAAVAYPAYESGTPDVFYGVFAAYEAGLPPPDSGPDQEAGPSKDANPDHATGIDAPFGVAAVAYPAYEAGVPKDA